MDPIHKIGFAHADGRPPQRVKRANVRLIEDRLVVTVNGKSNRMTHWRLDEPPAHVCEQIHRLSGLAVAVTTKTLPTRMAPSDFPAAFADPEVLVGWVPLAGRKSSPRSKG